MSNALYVQYTTTKFKNVIGYRIGQPPEYIIVTIMVVNACA